MKVFELFFLTTKYSGGSSATSFCGDTLFYRNIPICEKFDDKFSIIMNDYHLDKKISLIIDKLKIYLKEKNIKYNTAIING